MFLVFSEAEGLDIEGESHHVTGTQENESVNTYYGEDAEPSQVQVRLVPTVDMLFCLSTVHFSTSMEVLTT